MYSGTDAELAALQTEITTDPNAYGYDLASGNLNNVVSLINEKRAGITVSKPRISAADVRTTVTFDAYNALAIDEQEWIRWITGTNGFNEENLVVTPDVRQKLAGDPAPNDAIWSAGTRDEMNAAILALIDVQGSRAEQLFGHGSALSVQDIQAARDYAG